MCSKSMKMRKSMKTVRTAQNKEIHRKILVFCSRQMSSYKSWTLCFSTCCDAGRHTLKPVKYLSNIVNSQSTGNTGKHIIYKFRRTEEFHAQYNLPNTSARFIFISFNFSLQLSSSVHGNIYGMESKGMEKRWGEHINWNNNNHTFYSIVFKFIYSA